MAITSAGLLQGGLNAVAPQPQGAPPQGQQGMPPQQPQSSEGSTNKALGALHFADNVSDKMQAANLADSEYAQLLREELADLPSAAAIKRARQQQQTELSQAYAPKERSGWDSLFAGLANIRSTDRGDFSKAMQEMYQGSTAHRKQAEAEERAKTLARAQMAGEDAGAMSKRRMDLLKEMGDLTGKQMGGTSGGQMIMLPDGRPGMKLGTRLYAFNKDGTREEVITSEKGVMGADSLFNQFSQIYRDTYSKMVTETDGKVPLEVISQKAYEVANERFKQLKGGTGVGDRPMTPAPATPQLGGPQGTPPPQQGMPPPAMQQRPPMPTPQQPQEPEMLRVGNINVPVGLVNQFNQQDRATVMRTLERYEMQPNEGTLRAFEQAMAGATAKLGGTSQPPTQQLAQLGAPLPRRDPGKAAFTKNYMEGEGASMQKAAAATGETISKNSGLMSTLNVLEGIFRNPNVGEGEAAKALTQISSGLKTFGIDLGGATGEEQVALALSNEMALKMRTAGDANLMPGAMSNFDAQLLQSMAPNLNQTREGRAALIGIMRSMADSHLRIAQEAQKFMKENNGVLTPEWRERAAELERKEMVRREVQRRSIMKKFGGTQ